MENRNCQNCKQDFNIEQEDFNFYKKIKVPPPTFCPECRYIRRLLDRNEYNLYRRKCDATGKDIISIYRPEAPFPVYEQEYWKSDNFEAKDYGRDFDFSRPFFEQYEELRRSVPHLAMVNSRSVNSEYTNQSQDNKDCYMLVTSGSNEKCMYGSWNEGSYMLGDCYMAEKSEFSYECVSILKCSNCAWINDCADCVNIYFSSDCRACTDCLGCVGLRNKQYYWFNENIGKEEYQKRFKELAENRKSLNDLKEKFSKFRLTVPVKYYHGFSSYNSTGDYIQNMQNTKLAFNCRGNKDSSYMQDVWQHTEDCRDCTEIILGELAYEIQGVETPHRSMVIRSCFNTITDSCYCDMCFSTQDCFGCFGLKKGKYCILNKQYSEEEYFALKEKIIEHMKQTKEWGEYFPSSVSPFSYNESMAQDYFPLNKEEALSKGYSWYDRPNRDYKFTLQTAQLPESFKEVKDNIFEEVIQCSSVNEDDYQKNHPLCTTAFKITPMEMNLYKILNLPIPEKCFSCRRQERFKLRNPRRLWTRECMCNKAHANHEGPCKVEFETSYPPEGREIVYCEKCYQQEVY